MAWYSKNSGETTHPVGQKQPNAWGLYDMHGNVAEWCANSLYGYPREPATDPAPLGGGDRRVVRGGSRGERAVHCRSASRSARPPDTKSMSVGLRVALSLPPVPEAAPTPKAGEDTKPAPATPQAEPGAKPAPDPAPAAAP